MSTQTAEALLATYLESWKALLTLWSIDGSLSAAAQEALLLDGGPEALTDLITQWSAGDYRQLPPIVLLSNADISGAMGAYAISTGTIYINQDWLLTASQAQVEAVLTEELGHHLDGLLNEVDTPGDEGEIFSSLLRGLTPASSAFSENDQRLINLNGMAVAVEASVNHAPTGSLSISGSPIVGQTITASNTLADADGLGTISYQWNANGLAIAGATASTLLLTQNEVGKAISVTASYTDGLGTAEAVSKALVASTPTRQASPGRTGGEYRNILAFAALKDDGSVVTWGDSGSGGNSSGVAGLSSGVIQIFSNYGAFAALKEDGSVVSWGGSGVAGLSSGVRQIFSAGYAFAALKDDGSVVTWGSSNNGGNSSGVTGLSSGVSQIFSAQWAFAALKDDGSVVTWGNNNYGGNSNDVAGLSSGVSQLFSTTTAFAALKDDGSVVTWGDSTNGGNSSGVAGLSSGVIQISSTDYAFAALKDDGSVITWGDSRLGGDSSYISGLSSGVSVAGLISSGVSQIFSNYGAFAALKEDGSVVTWGGQGYGGNSSDVAGPISSGVTQIFSNNGAFAALKDDGSVVTWGFGPQGGDSSGVAGLISSSVSQIFSTYGAFAALKDDGSVVTWGDTNYGGNSNDVAGLISSGVRQIFSTDYAFAALKDDGSVITWGGSGYGGNSSGVAGLSSGVVGMANPFTDDDLLFVQQNNPPTITSGATASIAENSSGIAYQATASDPDGTTTFSWILSGSDKDLFNIDGTTGAVSFKASPNYEAPSDDGASNVYEIAVTASDGSLSSTPKALAINVLNVQEPGSIGAITSSNGTTFEEGDTLTAGAVTDPDNISEAITYAWLLGGVQVQSGASNTYVVGPQGAGSYTVVATYIDGTGETVTATSDARVVAKKDNGVRTFADITTSDPAGLVEGVTLNAGALGPDIDGDATGPAATYKWFKDGIEIAGVTGATYKTSDTGTGDYKVATTYKDAQDFIATVESAAQAVAKINNGQASFSINGTTAVGVTLNATSTSDPDGNGPFTYTWETWSGGTWAGVGTDSPSYDVVAADEGKDLRLRLVYNDAQGFAEEVITQAGTVPFVNDGPAGVVINGTPAVGVLLTTTITADPDGTGTLDYSWQTQTGSTWSEVGSASSYTVAPADEGKSLRLRVSYTDLQGFLEAVTVDAGTVPFVNDGKASFTVTGATTPGAPAVNDPLVATPGTPDPDGNGTFSYAWQTFANNTWSTVGSTSIYTVTATDEGKAIQLIVSYTDAQTFAETVTVPAGTVAPYNNGPASISIGGSIAVDNTLSANITTPDPDGNGTGGFTCQWQTSTDAWAWFTVAIGPNYKLVPADEGKNLRLLTTYNDAQGFAESVVVSGGVVPAYNNGKATFTVTGVSNANAPALNEILTATSGTPDPDGNGPFTYVWETSTNGSTWGSVGTNSPSYTVSLTDEGKQLRLRVNYTDAQQFPEEVITPAGTVPGIAPFITGITVQGTQAILQFSEAIVTTGLTASRFTATVGGAGRTVSSPTPVAGDTTRLSITLSGKAATSTQAVAVSYTDLTTGNDASGVVQDAIGTDMAPTTTPFTAESFSSGSSVTSLGTSYTNLVLTGTGKINGTGNANANRLTGNSGNNVLDGLNGNDTHTGGAGADVFYFSTAANTTTNRDTITDFTSGVDKIRIKRSAYPGLSGSSLTAAQFGSNNTNTFGTTSERFHYNTSTGTLLFDQDGSGTANSAVEVALLGVGTALARGDFALVA